MLLVCQMMKNRKYDMTSFISDTVIAKHIQEEYSILQNAKQKENVVIGVLDPTNHIYTLSIEFEINPSSLPEYIETTDETQFLSRITVPFNATTGEILDHYINWIVVENVRVNLSVALKNDDEIITCFVYDVLGDISKMFKLQPKKFVKATYSVGVKTGTDPEIYWNFSIEDKHTPIILENDISLKVKEDHIFLKGLEIRPHKPDK